MLSRDTESLGKMAKLSRKGINVCSALMRVSDFKLEPLYMAMGRMGGALLLHGPSGEKVQVSLEANGHWFRQTSESGFEVLIK